MLKLIIAAAVAVAMACSSGSAPTAPDRPALAEDDPGWDCSTQGNLVCGAEHQGQAG